MNLNTTAKDNNSKASSLTFSPNVNPKSTSEFIIIGRKEFLTSDIIENVVETKLPSNVPVINAMLHGIKDSGKSTSYLPLLDGASIKKLTIIIPPPTTKISRNNHPFSPHFLSDALVDIGLNTSACETSVQICVIDGDVERYMVCLSVAIARALPLYHSKSLSTPNGDVEDDCNATGGGTSTGVNVSYFNDQGQPIKDDVSTPSQHIWSTCRAAASGVRLAAKLGDMPPAELSPDVYASICKSIAMELNTVNGDNAVSFQEIVGEELHTLGYGGVYGVGMAAQCPPRLIVMSYTPAEQKIGDGVMEHVALCGKGVIYDTGGLSLKPKVGMCGMKHDMGGSAGVLGAFQAAVQLKLPKKVTLILAIVENAIGPDSVRNDDILTMKSGKTVEINNADAEGRLILADCVSHASKCLKDKVDVILDMATLTGAVSITTGRVHAGILAKTQSMEERISKAGMRSGDLVYPMLYAPELLKVEFASKVADMKNSVKNRNNAQASCAGHFIESHLDEEYEGDWIHVDMAGPDSKNERATGYGVALVLGLLEAPGLYQN